MMAVVAPTHVADNLALPQTLVADPTTTLVHRPGLPKKLGSDRLLLVSKALHEIPTYKSISPELQKQRQSLRRLSEYGNDNDNDNSSRRRVHFRAIDHVHEYDKDYDASDHSRLWFSDAEFAAIFDRDDDDYTVCYAAMSHTKQILQLWGMCSRAASVAHLNAANAEDDADTTTEQELPEPMVHAVDTLFHDAPHPHARGLEHRIITGIRNHRQKAVQSFLQHTHAQSSSDGSSGVDPRYLKFSLTASQFARVLAEGDARVAHMIQTEEDSEETTDNQHQPSEEWGSD